MSTPETELKPKLLTIPEFAGKIRAKYPKVYDNLSDDQLATRVLQKHRQYSSQVDTGTVEANEAATNAADANQIQAGTDYHVKRAQVFPAMSATGRALNPVPVKPLQRPKLGANEEGIVSLAEDSNVNPSPTIQNPSVKPESLTRPRTVTPAPVSLAPVIQSHLESVKQQRGQAERQQRVARARANMNRGAFSGLTGGVQGQPDTRTALGLPQPISETLSTQGIQKAKQRESIRPQIEQQVRSELAQRKATESRVPAGIISQERISSPERLTNEAEIQREVDLRTQEAVPEMEWRQQNQPEIDRLTNEYRQVLRSRGYGPDKSKWTAETLAKGGAGVTEFLAGAVKQGGRATGLVTGNSSSTDEAANQMRIHAEALQKAAMEEGADRNQASKFVSDVAGGLVGSAPEMGLMALGVPGPLAFAIGGGTRATGQGKPAGGPTLKGLATGAAFEMGAAGQGLTRIATKAGGVGLGTAGVELATGATPREAAQAGATNALISLGFHAKEVPKAVLDYTVQSPLTPEPVRDALARMGKYDTWLYRAEDGRNMSIYRDPQTGAFGAVEIDKAQADKYDQAVNPGKKAKQTRQTTDVESDVYDDLARALGVETTAPSKRIAAPDQKPEGRAEKPNKTDDGRQKPQQNAPDQSLESRAAKPSEIIPEIIQPAPTKAESEVIPQVQPTPLYHGGPDIEGGVLKRYGNKGQDAGGIFLTPSREYAEQYVKPGGGVYEASVPPNAELFDPSNQAHVDRLANGYRKLYEQGEYDSLDDAMSDFGHASSSDLADWSVGSQYVDAMEAAGFQGAKFRERPGNIGFNGEEYSVSGEPIESIAIFSGEVPVTRLKSEVQPAEPAAIAAPTSKLPVEQIPQGAERSAPPASVNEELKARGYSQDTIDKLTPEQADDLAHKRRTVSWVIKNKLTGEVIMETFDKKKVAALNTEKYEAVPINEHLQSLSAPQEGTRVPSPASEEVAKSVREGEPRTVSGWHFTREPEQAKQIVRQGRFSHKSFVLPEYPDPANGVWIGTYDPSDILKSPTTKDRGLSLTADVRPIRFESPEELYAFVDPIVGRDLGNVHVGEISLKDPLLKAANRQKVNDALKAQGYNAIEFGEGFEGNSAHKPGDMLILDPSVIKNIKPIGQTKGSEVAKPSSVEPAVREGEKPERLSAGGAQGARTNAPSLESPLNRLSGEAELFGSSRNAQAFRDKGLRGLDVADTLVRGIARSSAEQTPASNFSAAIKTGEHAPIVTPIKLATKGETTNVTTTPSHTSVEGVANLPGREGLAALPSKELPSAKMFKSPTAPQNRGTYKGKKFWIGTVSTLDGQIENVYGREEAEAGDNHHEKYMRAADVDGINSGDRAMFWIDSKGEIQSQWRNKQIPAELKAKIEEQLAAEGEEHAQPPEKSMETPAKPVRATGVTESTSRVEATGEAAPKEARAEKGEAKGPAEPLEDRPESETKKSKLAQGVNAKAIEAKLTQGFEGLPEYEKVKVADQAEKAAALLELDFEEAKRIALGQDLPPTGLLPESVFVAVENYALKNGDVELLRELATASTLSMEATGMGQRIRMLGERNPYSPVTAMREIQEVRQKKSEQRHGKKAKERIKIQIKTEVRKALPKTKDWNEFLRSIECVETE